jgi:hypothetical protein
MSELTFIPKHTALKTLEETIRCKKHTASEKK